MTDSLQRKWSEHDSRTLSKALLYQHKSFKKILEICLAGDEIKTMAGYKRRKLHGHTQTIFVTVS